MSRNKILIVALVTTFLISGCSVWRDFTAYFNMYYNTSDLFDQAELLIKEGQKDPFVINDPPIQANAQALVNKVIEKCSKILQFDSKSSFVDDALLMIGKCFYYQKNYIKALRKFEELQNSYPESSLVLESQLWFAKTELQQKNTEKGLADLLKVRNKAAEDGNNDILTATYIEEIKSYLEREDYIKVHFLAAELLKIANDNKLKARVLYLQGDINEKENKLTEAVEAYSSIPDYTSAYEMKFNSAIKLVKILLKKEEYDRALDLLYDLRSEAKYKEFYDQIDLVKAVTYKKKGDLDNALKILLPYDSLYMSSTQLGNARYEKASIYEHELKNYDSALVYYQKALSSTATVEYLQRIKERAFVFNKYSTYLASYNDFKKQYFYVLYPAEFKKDSIAFARDTAKTNVSKAADTTAKMGIVLERERRFEEVEGDEITYLLAKSKDTLKKAIKLAPQKPILSADSLKVNLSKSAIELGSLFLVDLNIPDSAFYYYNLAISNYDNQQYQAKALFALGSYYLTVNDTINANALFNKIYDEYKTDKIVNNAAMRINKPKLDFDFDPAREKYLEAEKLYKEKKYSDSYSKYYDIAITHPSSSFAAKSFLAAGKILEDDLKLSDSAAVVYDTLVVKYPSTVYAQSILPKITFYKDEKKRIKQAIQDSLKAISDSIANLRKADSLKIIEADSASVKKPVDSVKVTKSEIVKSVVSDSLSTVVTPTAEEKPDSTYKPNLFAPAPDPSKLNSIEKEPVKKPENEEEPEKSAMIYKLNIYIYGCGYRASIALALS